jgi:mono/diheme cytochrome c family protein
MSRTGSLCWLATGAILLSQPSASAQDQAKVEAGGQTYTEYCSTCHGDNLVNSGITFDLRRLKATERARFENSVLNGKNQMPPRKGVLNAEQIETLWHYIRANAADR